MNEGLCMNDEGDLCVNQHLYFTSQILRVIDPFREKFGVFRPSGFDIQRDSDLETSKIKFHLMSSNN